MFPIVGEKGDLVMEACRGYKVMDDPVSIDEVGEPHSLGSSLVDRRRSE